MVTTGRFAPSPTGRLHLGNLRTALWAWLSARSRRGRFVLRFEDLDAPSVHAEHYGSQQRDLAALGVDFDGEPWRQSDHVDGYRDTIASLQQRGLTYPCWCTRREIQEAALAPNRPDLPEGAYPGTCRQVDTAGRTAMERSGRRPALRLRADGAGVEFEDRLHGECRGAVDDFVLQRGDGTPTYNLAVVVDDGAQGVTEVVRGDDLLASTARQIHLARLLRITPPSHAHVPLVLGPDGARLAKRHGAVTLSDQAALGRTPADVLRWAAVTMGLPVGPDTPVATVADLLALWDESVLVGVPTVFP